ncbi:hypothetical protein A2U01_0033116, partial [Trifolium medium]|nr:hypothetical protein [Trifolium medium]
FEEGREDLVAGDGVFLENNQFLALTWLEGEDLGEIQEGKADKSTSAVKSRNRRLVKSGSRLPCDLVNLGDVAVISNEESNGPISLWASKNSQDQPNVLVINKGKGILEDFGEVAMKDRELFIGGTSSYVFGPNGPSQNLFYEFQFVKLLKNKEVAQLEVEYNKELSLEKICVKSHRKKIKKLEGSGNSAMNALFSGTTKTGRFVKAALEGVGGRQQKNKNKKGRKGRSKELYVEEEVSISDVSTDMGLSKGNGG